MIENAAKKPEFRASREKPVLIFHAMLQFYDQLSAAQADWMRVQASLRISFEVA